jgi:hypothetical protein
MKMLRNLLFFSLLTLLGACTPTIATRYQLPVTVVSVEKKTSKFAPPAPVYCPDYTGYIPDLEHPNYLPIKYIRVNFHIMNSADSSQNFKPVAARIYYKDLIEKANEALATNEPNWQSPVGTPVLPKQYRYVIAPQKGDDGFYFHYNDEDCYYVATGKYQNNYSTKVIDKYAIGKDSIINCFAMIHHPDSIKSRTYRATWQGIALGLGFKMAGLYESKVDPKDFDGLMNHEIGHILTLPHAWMEDGCPDTKNHPNKCFVRELTGFCDTNATNNMMDYNMYQIAMTPCQIGKVQSAFANEKNKIRKCLVPNWCTLNPKMDIVIRDSIAWTGARDLEGNLSIAKGGVLKLSCRTSIPHNGSITVKPGGKLILEGAKLHNACKQSWKGVIVEEKNGIKGEVEIIGIPIIENVEN